MVALTGLGCMEHCNAMHICWTLGPLHRQRLILASAKAQPISDFHDTFFELLPPGVQCASINVHSLDYVNNILHIKKNMFKSNINIYFLEFR